MKNNYINEEIGVRLRNLRQNADYSLQDIAERVGISRFTYYNFERGRRTISVDLLKKICDAYNYNYLELLEEGNGEMEKICCLFAITISFGAINIAKTYIHSKLFCSQNVAKS